jgi:3-oxoacyl-[acyl-carrier-protein] synthase I
VNPIPITHFTLASALGRGVEATLQAVSSARSGLAPCRFETARLDTFVGEIEGLDEVALPTALKRFDCRNNRAAELGLAQDGFLEAVQAAARRHGPQRVGVFIGTSTAGILEAELAYRRRDGGNGPLPRDFDYRHTHNTFSAAAFVRERLGLQGPCAAVSTACSSSAKAFAAAARYIAAGLVDAAVVGGVDTLCLTTLYGFNSLDLLSPEPCRPYDAQRSGISIGEAAAFFLLDRDGPPDAVALLGAGETSDAYHMSSPHPEGRGAREAMQLALAAARLDASRIDYVNLHGTGTPSNDAAEDKAMHAVFPGGVACNSTKGFTGHTLGAAGAVEAAMCLLAIRGSFVPASPGTRNVDPSLRAHYETRGFHRAVDVAMSNSFGFGGTNCSLILGRAT